jgi:cobalt-zinc-cadmium efflux system membrane fusion protein
MKVRLTSADVAAKAGVSTVTPQTVSLSNGIDLPARVKFNRNNLAHITPLSAGIMLKVHVQPGSRVNKGEFLAEIAMPEIASLKGQFLAANARQTQTEATYKREKNLMERGITSAWEFQQAEAEYRAARSASEQYRQQLLNYGLKPATIAQLLIDGKSSAALFLRAPLSGTVVSVETAVGEAVEPGTPLFTLANLDSLWVELSVPESRIYQIQDNAMIQARFNGLPDMVFTGQVFQTGAVVDERTRTLKVLAEVKNTDQRLKVGMFGNVRLLEGTEEQVLTVSANALQNIDGKSYVFIQQESDLFDLRRVKVGAKADGMVIILAGLSLNDQVVTSQGFALKSEVLKARLGASCADH